MKDLKEKICPSIRADCRYGYGDNVCDNCNKILDEYIAEHDKQVRADAIEEIKHQMISFHTDAIFLYGADIVEARCDAFDNLENWLKEQNNAK